MAAITFSPSTDVMFDYRGVTQLPSGTAPHNPSQARIVLRNCQTTIVRGFEHVECRAVAEIGEEELERFVRNNFSPVGRAADDPFWPKRRVRPA